MNWRNAWRWWIFYLTAGPILGGFSMGIVGAIKKDSSGQLVWKDNGDFHFDWKIGLAGFVGFAILALLLFVASIGVRYLFRRFRGPN
jgi:hypothetical protein